MCVAGGVRDRPLAKPGAESRQQQPVAEDHAKGQFVAAEHAQHLAHERQLRHRRHDAQRADRNPHAAVHFSDSLKDSTW